MRAAPYNGAMPRQRRHILAAVLWVVASVIVWVAILNGVVVLILRPLTRSLRSSGWLEVVGNTYNVIAVASAIVIPIVVAVLAIRRRLPWTGQRASRRRGFAVEKPASGFTRGRAGASAKGVASRSNLLREPRR